MNHRRVVVLGIVALLALPLAACENTIEGLEEDTQQNVEQLDEEVND
jgi:predicted small secreted protein